MMAQKARVNRSSEPIRDAPNGGALGKFLTVRPIVAMKIDIDTPKPRTK